jgi:SH3 domain-containing YSC84-like protein 1
MSLSGDNVTLGGDASVSAGPVGRNAQIETTVAMNTGIFSYSRSKGLFAGISLKGSVVGPQKDLVKKYYGEDITAEKVLFSGTVMPSAAGQKLIEQLRQY